MDTRVSVAESYVCITSFQGGTYIRHEFIMLRYVLLYQNVKTSKIIIINDTPASVSTRRVQVGTYIRIYIYDNNVSHPKILKY